jgi:hypothetical protein
MKLYLFEKTYNKIFKNLDQEYDIFKEKNRNKRQKYTKVILRSYLPKSKVELRAIIKTLLRKSIKVKTVGKKSK